MPRAFRPSRYDAVLTDLAFMKRQIALLETTIDRYRRAEGENGASSDANYECYLASRLIHDRAAPLTKAGDALGSMCHRMHLYERKIKKGELKRPDSTTDHLRVWPRGSIPSPHYNEADAA